MTHPLITQYDTSLEVGDIVFNSYRSELCTIESIERRFLEHDHVTDEYLEQHGVIGKFKVGMERNPWVYLRSHKRLTVSQYDIGYCSRRVFLPKG